MSARDKKLVLRKLRAVYEYWEAIPADVRETIVSRALLPPDDLDKVMGFTNPPATPIEHMHGISRSIVERVEKEVKMHDPMSTEATQKEVTQWAQALMRSGFNVLDTETTGANTEEDEAVQIAVCDQDGKEVFNHLVKPSRHIHPKAMEVHGITEADVSKVLPFTRRMREFTLAISGKPLVVYNLRFDKSILLNSAVLFRGLLEARLDSVLTDCAMLQFAAWYGEKGRYGKPKWKKLTFAAEVAGYTTEGAHDALVDVRMTAAVIRYLAEQS